MHNHPRPIPTRVNISMFITLFVSDSTGERGYAGCGYTENAAKADADKKLTGNLVDSKTKTFPLLLNSQPDAKRFVKEVKNWYRKFGMSNSQALEGAVYAAEQSKAAGQKLASKN